jgi:ABC-2 type transport system permease protein
MALVAASLGLITLPTHLAEYRDRGVLRRFEASAIPLSSVLGAQVMVTIVIALLGSLLVVGAGAAAYDVHAPEAVPAVFAAFILTALAFASIGVFLGVAFPTARASQGAGILLWFVMLILGGAGPPLEVLSDAMRMVGDATPLSHAITLIQDPWLGFGWNLAETLAMTAYLGAAAALATLTLKLRTTR